MPEQSRKLAAIMFTDIVGYTSLMGDDEQMAMQVLRKNRRIHKSIIKKHQGKWLKEMGDGTLASFTTTSDAVYCAGEIMDACKAEEIALRIGIHQGEIVEEDGDIFGDGVNVASRIEPIAEPEQILASEPIHRNIKNKDGIDSTFVKEVELKNVDDPVKVYHIVVDNSKHQIELPGQKSLINKKSLFIAAGLALTILLIYSISYYANIKMPQNPEKSDKSEIVDKTIAVIPFDNMSNDSTQDYFSDGVMEDILTNLHKIRELKVTPSLNVKRYNQTTKDVSDIARELDVAHILLGRVWKYNNTVIIKVELFDANEELLWEHSYEEDLSDIRVFHSEVAQSVAAKLKATLSPTELKTLKKVPKVNPKSYELFLLGKYYIRKQKGRENIPYLKQAINPLKSAIEIDPKFVNAYAELGFTYSELGFWGEKVENEDSWQQSEFYLKKALELDEDNPHALRYMAYLIRTSLWDWEGSEEYYKRSLSISPNDDETLRYYALLFSATNKHDSAVFYAEKARELNPLDGQVWFTLIRVLYNAKRYEEALYESESAVHTDSPLNLSTRINILVGTDKDLVVLELIDIYVPDESSKKQFFELYRDNGWKKFTEGLYEYLAQDIKENIRFSGVTRTIIVNGAPTDIVFDYLFNEIRNKVGLIVYILADPIYDPIRSDPRFDELLEIMGLDKYK